ncbi:MAG: TIGR00282 family metallophosphoesterase [Clostridia bacterium]
MKILFIGDVVGIAGTNFLSKRLPQLKRENNIDITIVNGENSAIGNGITRESAKLIFDSGADVITSGNHVWQKKVSYDLLNENEYIVRPANYPKESPGVGFVQLDKIKYKINIINLLGTVFLDSLDCPFRVCDEILKENKATINFVDFHAEATSEKKAFAMYFANRLSAVVGTHTHVQTNDAQIINGTAFITDVGMVGAQNSILGIAPEPVINKFITKLPQTFLPAEGKCFLNGVIIECDEKNGNAIQIETLNIYE